MIKRLKEKLGMGGMVFKQRSGGLNMFELIISLLIITITSVTVASSFYTAHGELSRQRRRMLANQLLKAEAEFWKGRIHSAFPSPFEMQHPIPNPNNPIALDPDVQGASIVLAEVWKDPVRSVDIPQTRISPDWYEFRVWITYEEPSLDRIINPGPSQNSKKVTYELVVPFLPAATG